MREAIQKIRKKRPFKIFASVLLPDHWHLIMQLPSGDRDYPLRLKQIKESFSCEWLAAGMPEAAVTVAQREKGERGIWQPRYWEHTIADESDLERCVDYIHWNPRKHGLVRRIQDWPWSSFHRFVIEGQYEIDWGGELPTTIKTDQDWGEP